MTESVPPGGSAGPTNPARPSAGAKSPDVDEPPRLHSGVAAAVSVALVISALWYVAVIGTQSQMMPISLMLGWAVGGVMTRVAGRHGVYYALYAIAITFTLTLVMIFYIQRRSLNFDPRNHIPLWANPTIVADVFRVGFASWPLHYLWLIAATAVGGYVGWHGPYRDHPLFVRLYHRPADHGAALANQPVASVGDQIPD